MEPTQEKSNAVKYIVGLIIVAIVIIGASVASNKQKIPYKAVVQPSENQTEKTDTARTTTEKLFSEEEIATHNTKDSCFSTINGKVYDLTEWIYKHPGGASKILSICGKDGSSAFDRKHAGQPKPEEILTGFEIGILAK